MLKSGTFYAFDNDSASKECRVRLFFNGYEQMLLGIGSEIDPGNSQKIQKMTQNMVESFIGFRKRNGSAYIQMTAGPLPSTPAHRSPQRSSPVDADPGPAMSAGWLRVESSGNCIKWVSIQHRMPGLIALSSSIF